MLKLKMLILSCQLYISGLFLSFLKKSISHPLKKEAPLSRKIIIIPHRIYEHLLRKWCEKEQKFILLFLRFNSIDNNNNL